MSQSVELGVHIEDLCLSEEESPWVEYDKGVFLRYLMFDVRDGTWGVVTRTEGPAGLGRHRHSYPVHAYTMRGSWGYREYDWVARKGSYVRENPGVIHTLYCDDPNGMEAFFLSGGVNERFDENDNVIDRHTVFYHIAQYKKHCAAHGLPVNPRLFR